MSRESRMRRNEKKKSEDKKLRNLKNMVRKFDKAAGEFKNEISVLSKMIEDFEKQIGLMTAAGQSIFNVVVGTRTPGELTGFANINKILERCVEIQTYGREIPTKLQEIRGLVAFAKRNVNNTNLPFIIAESVLPAIANLQIIVTDQYRAFMDGYELSAEYIEKAVTSGNTEATYLKKVFDEISAQHERLEKEASTSSATNLQEFVEGDVDIAMDPSIQIEEVSLADLPKEGQEVLSASAQNS